MSSHGDGRNCLAVSLISEAYRGGLVLGARPARVGEVHASMQGAKVFPQHSQSTAPESATHLGFQGMVVSITSDLPAEAGAAYCEIGQSSQLAGHFVQMET